MSEIENAPYKAGSDGPAVESFEAGSSVSMADFSDSDVYDARLRFDHNQTAETTVDEQFGDLVLVDEDSPRPGGGVELDGSELVLAQAEVESGIAEEGPAEGSPEVGPGVVAEGEGDGDGVVEGEGDVSATQLYNRATDTYSWLAYDKGAAEQAYEMWDSKEFPDTEEGQEQALKQAETDLLDAGADKLTYVVSPDKVGDVEQAFSDESDGATGHWADEENKIAYINPGLKGGDSAEEVAKLLDEQFPDAKGIIIDLRGNPGGRVDEALEMAALFVDQGVLLRNDVRVLTDQSGGFNYETNQGEYSVTDSTLEKPVTPTRFGEDTDNPNGIVSEDRGEFYDRTDGTPITILADEGTISSAEILLSALRQNGEANALVIGEQTGGKGIQEIFYKDPETGVMSIVTNGRLLRPDGGWAGDYDQNRFGAQPDIEIPSDVTDLGENDIQYREAILNLISRAN